MRLPVLREPQTSPEALRPRGETARPSAARLQEPAGAGLGGGKPGAQAESCKETLSPGAVQVQGWPLSVSP